MTEEFEEIQQLQKDIYELNGELYENSKLMAEELSDMMNSHVRDLYKEEYIRIRSDYEIERRQKEFRTKERRAIYVPYSRRFLFFHRMSNQLQYLQIISAFPLFSRSIIPSLKRRSAKSAFR